MRKKCTPEQQRKRHMKHRYGLEPEEYYKMFEIQSNRCFCCGLIGGDTRGHKLRVDHDHLTNKVRKLVCNRCNQIAGALEDEKCLNVLLYLREHNSNALARLELLLKENENCQQSKTSGSAS